MVRGCVAKFRAYIWRPEGLVPERGTAETEPLLWRAMREVLLRFCNGTYGDLALDRIKPFVRPRSTYEARGVKIIRPASPALRCGRVVVSTSQPGDQYARQLGIGTLTQTLSGGASPLAAVVGKCRNDQSSDTRRSC
jgi:hypothetical protein